MADEGGMRFCEDHWRRLTAAIEERGLGHLIVGDAETAIAQVADQLKRGERGEEEIVTAANYDPLMGAHWSIATNVMNLLGRGALYLLSPGPEDPVEGYPGYEGRTWPRCPLCYIGLAHEMTCKDRRCQLPKVDGYAWMIDRAADDAVERVKQLEAGG